MTTPSGRLNQNSSARGKIVVIVMGIFIEPAELYFKRAAQKRSEFDRILQNSPADISGWDSAIMRFFVTHQGSAVLFMRAVNALAKQCCARNKRERESASLLIMRAMGRLIREGRLVRVHRRFVRVHMTQVTAKPIISFHAGRKGQ
jgi:hypothetical protein